MTKCLEGCRTLCMERYIVTHHNVNFNGRRSYDSRNILYLICLVTQDHKIKESWDLMERTSWLYVTTLPSLVVIVIVVMEIWLIYFSSDLARKNDQKVLWLYGRKLLIVCHHPARFGTNRHCGVGDINFLIYHSPLCNHVFKRLHEFMGERFSKKVLTLPSLVTIGLALVEIYRSNNSRDFAKARNQRTSWLYERKFLSTYLHPTKFGSYWHCVSGYVMISVCQVISQEHVIIWSCDFISRSHLR